MAHVGRKLRGGILFLERLFWLALPFIIAIILYVLVEQMLGLS